MRIFNLAEELEKERKKNKELEEENKKLNNIIYKDYVVKDLENKNYWLKIDNRVYKSRIDSAIKLIEQYDSMTAIVKKPDEEGIFGFDGNFGIKEELLDILKGSDNNDRKNKN